MTIVAIMTVREVYIVAIDSIFPTNPANSLAMQQLDDGAEGSKGEESSTHAEYFVCAVTIKVNALFCRYHWKGCVCE